MFFIRCICLFLLLNSVLVAALLKPYNNQIVSYTHILFEWEQNPDASEYQIQLSNSATFSDSDDLLLDTQTSKLVYIYTGPIDWDNIYFWRVRDIYSDNSYGPWTIPSEFRIDQKNMSLIQANYL